MNFTSYSPICIQLFSKYLGLFLPLGGGLRSTAHFWVKSECLGAFSLSSKETVGVWLSLSVIVDQHVQGAQRAQGVLGCPVCPGCPWVPRMPMIPWVPMVFWVPMVPRVPILPCAQGVTHPKILHFFNGMGPRLGNAISPCFFTFLGAEYDRPSLILFVFRRKFFASCKMLLNSLHCKNNKFRATPI